MNTMIRWPAALAAALFLYGSGDSALAQDQQDQQLEGDLEEVVVTAMRRGEQIVLEIPASVTAFTGDYLEERGFFDLRDFLQMAPGVSLANNGGFQAIQIRGISSGLGSPTVGYYVDESPFSFVSSNVSPDSRTFDLERVEVLRGPQGTLYGQGSIAGVIKLITRNPDLNEADFNADVSLSNTKDGGWNQQYAAAFGIPIIQDTLAIRFTGLYEDWDGWIDGLPGNGFDLFGVPITFDSGPDKNSEEHKSGRVKVLWTPTDNTTVTALYWISDTDNGAPNWSNEDRTATFAIPQPIETKYQYAYLTVEHEAESFTFLSNTSYTKADYISHFDFLGTDLFSLIANDGWSQEFRFNSTGDGPWYWTVGALYQELEQRIFQDVDQRIADAFGLDDVDQIDDTTNWAIFGDVTYEFNEQWNVSVGGRYFKDTRNTFDTIGVYIGDEVVEQKFDDFSPRFNIAWHPTDRSRCFSRQRRGFEAG